MNPRLQVQAGHFTYKTTDLAEIFMNILVTHKILFHSAKERRKMREKNQFDISKTIAHSVCLFANSFSLSECNEFESGDSACAWFYDTF